MKALVVKRISVFNVLFFIWRRSGMSTFGGRRGAGSRKRSGYGSGGRGNKPANFSLAPASKAAAPATKELTKIPAVSESEHYRLDFLRVCY